MTVEVVDSADPGLQEHPRFQKRKNKTGASIGATADSGNQRTNSGRRMVVISHVADPTPAGVAARGRERAGAAPGRAPEQRRGGVRARRARVDDFLRASERPDGTPGRDGAPARGHVAVPLPRAALAPRGEFDRVHLVQGVGCLRVELARPVLPRSARGSEERLARQSIPETVSKPPPLPPPPPLPSRTNWTRLVRPSFRTKWTRQSIPETVSKLIFVETVFCRHRRECRLALPAAHPGCGAGQPRGGAGRGARDGLRAFAPRAGAGMGATCAQRQRPRAGAGKLCKATWRRSRSFSASTPPSARTRARPSAVARVTYIPPRAVRCEHRPALAGRRRRGVVRGATRLHFAKQLAARRFAQGVSD